MKIKKFAILALASLLVIGCKGKKESSSIDETEGKITEGGELPYDREYLPFGESIFDKTFIENNATELEYEPQGQYSITTEKFNYKPTTYLGASKAPVVFRNIPNESGKGYYSFVKKDFIVKNVTNDLTQAVWNDKTKEIGGLYFYKTTEKVALIDGYGNELLAFDIGRLSGDTFSVSQYGFYTGHAKHAYNEPAPDKVRFYCFTAEYTFKSSSLKKTVQYFVFYNDTTVTKIVEGSDWLCNIPGHHSGENAETIYHDRFDLTYTGHPGWYYTIEDEYYRVFTEMGKPVSDFKIPTDGTTYSQLKDSKIIFLKGGALIQLDYFSDTKSSTECYVSSEIKSHHLVNYIWNYENDSVTRLKQINYRILSEPIGVRYKNDYNDFAFAKIAFIEGNTMSEVTYDYLLDDKFVLRNDVTNLFYPGELFKTNGMYICRANLDSSTFKYFNTYDGNGNHLIQIKNDRVKSLNPKSHLLAYEDNNHYIGIIDYNGVYLTHAQYSDLHGFERCGNCDNFIASDVTDLKTYLINAKTNERKEIKSSYLISYENGFLSAEDLSYQPKDFCLYNAYTGEYIEDTRFKTSTGYETTSSYNFSASRYDFRIIYNELSGSTDTQITVIWYK